jgi:hypothetical protein
MRAEFMQNSQAGSGRNVAEINEWDREGDCRYRWRNTEMTDLTDSAGGCFVVIGVRVRNKLNQEQEREQRKREGQRFQESARERMRDRLHFRASYE